MAENSRPECALGSAPLGVRPSGFEPETGGIEKRQLHEEEI